MRRDVITIIEQAYDFGGPEQWLNRIAASVRPFLDEGYGLCALLYDATSPDWVIPTQFISLGLEPGLARLFAIPDDVNESIRKGGESAAIPTMYRTRTLGHARVLFEPYRIISAYYSEVFRAAGVEDLLCLNARDPTALGCFIGVPQRRRKALTPALRQFWSRVAAHLSAGYRIQRAVRALGAPLDGGPSAEALLDLDGRVRHAEGAATEQGAREALRQAALQVKRARGALRRKDPDAALEAWEGLVSGRWSLVDRFDRDGRRYLIAHRNEPGAPDVRGLTQRERQIVAYAALGHANKLTAYELGLSPAAISNHLAAAARKLRVRNRAELVELFWRLTGGTSADPSDVVGR